MSDGIISLRAYKLRSPGHIKMSFGPAAISDLRLLVQVRICKLAEIG
jgi:hypothetical protein